MAAPTLRERTSGVLLHPTSLPGRADLGRSSHAFVDWLARAGQSWWQMLPIGAPGYGGSPYSAESAFAASPTLLAEPSVHATDREIAAFEKNNPWLADYALFRALKEAHGGVAWTRWERSYRMRDKEALAHAEAAFAGTIARVKREQLELDRQWRVLREYAHARGIGLIGDVPIFVAHDSSDVWANRELFRLDEEGMPTVVAGVPPDYFSATGQRWGNPLYRWRHLERSGYEWWIERFRMTLARFDAVRLDHFIGFVRNWEIPANEPDAVNGRWLKGPGIRLFRAVADALGKKDLPLIAEDLGAVTPKVTKLRDTLRLPGIKVLQFAFGTDPQADSFLPHNYPRRAVVYTGTHDNDTTVGWFEGADAVATNESEQGRTRDAAQVMRERVRAMEYLPSDGRAIHWDMIRAAWASVARLAIAPMQDLLGLGSDARMNRPATIGPHNWTWKLKDGDLSDDLAARLAHLTEMYGRRHEGP